MLSAPFRNALAGIFLITSLLACSEQRQLSLLEKAEEKLSQNQYSEGAELLRRSIALNPESKTAVKALYKLGFTQETYLNDFEGALFNYLEFIRLAQDKVSLYEVQKRVANIYFDHHRDPEKSIAAYKKLIDLNPESLEADLFQFRIAQAYFRQNNFEQSRTEYQQLLEHFPKSPLNARARFEIGNSYYMESKYDIALEALKQAIRHHPQSEYAIEAQFLMAQCLETQNKLPGAIQEYESLRGRYPSADVLEIRVSELKKRLKKEK